MVVLIIVFLIGSIGLFIVIYNHNRKINDIEYMRYQYFKECGKNKKNLYERVSKK